MATIRDVAVMAEVSISTVSLAFNQPSRVSPDTNERVRNAAKALGYRPNPVAQSLKRGRSHVVGVVLGDLANPFFGRMLKGIEHYMQERNYLVVISDTGGNPRREMAVLEHLSSQRVAGIILAPHGHEPDYLEKIRALSMPVVLFDHKPPDIAYDFVGSDNRLASAMLTEHLIRFGHRRIVHIAGLSHLYTAVGRAAGFTDTMRAAGLEVTSDMIVDGYYDGEASYEATMQLLTRADRPTAIHAGNNVMALGALQAINDLGFRCPEDISLTSIDDVPWSNVIRPRLTMVVQQVDELARTAGEWLLERIDWQGDTPIAPRERTLIPKLVIGQSCGPPPTL